MEASPGMAGFGTITVCCRVAFAGGGSHECVGDSIRQCERKIVAFPGQGKRQPWLVS